MAMNLTVMKNWILLVFVFVAFSSCELLEGDGDSGPDIVAGLKEALSVGAQFASNELSASDGYFGNALYKILLPEEVQTNIDAFKALEIDVLIGTITGEQLYTTGSEALGIKSLQSIEDELILGINRAAESAATEAFPIFADAITGITFSDANNILFGGVDNAATTFLKDNTFQALFNTYEPKIQTAIDVVQINDVSVDDLYGNFITDYNDILATSIPTGLFSSSSLAELANLQVMENTDLSEFATQKGLDGLFIRVEQEEDNIRNNVGARISQILRDVFGQLD